LITVVASTAAADVTGIVMASLVATLGFLIIPARRRRAKRDMEQKVTALRQKLADALRAEFSRATAASAARIGETVAPYDRFVRAEQAHWQDARAAFSQLRDRTRAFRTRLNRA
jgi:hypothetical protein